MICPHCGESLRDDAPVCPECGSDAETGWSDAAVRQQLGWPPPLEEEEYRELVDELAGRPPPGRPKWLAAGAAAALAALVLFLLHWL